MTFAARAVWQYPAYLFLAAYSLVVVGPVLWMVVASVKPRAEFFSKPFTLPATVNWAGYQRAWSGGLLHYIANSLIITGISVAVILVAGGLAAYALARMRFVGRGIVYGIAIAAYAIPIHGILVPLYDTLVKLGLTNTYLGLILPYITFGLPFAIAVMYAFFLDFPDDMIEAAPDRRMLRPRRLSADRGSPVPAGLRQHRDLPGGADLERIPAGADRHQRRRAEDRAARAGRFRGTYVSDWNAILASITVTSVPMLILFIAFQKQFIRSLAGSSKG